MVAFSGEYRHRIELWDENYVKAEGGQKISSPVKVFSDVPAKIENYGGDEARRGDQVVADCTHVVTIRFLNNLETRPDWFIKVPRRPPGDGTMRRFNILRTGDPTGLRRELAIYCKEEVETNG